MYRFISVIIIGLFGAMQFSHAQTQLSWLNLPTEGNVTNGPTNGMWFTAPVDFTIKAVKVPDDSMNPYNPQSIAILKFTSGGASTSPATNYTVLFLVQDTMAPDSIPCNVEVLEGDHIGIIGSRWDASSNVGQCSNASSGNFSSSINGYATSLFKLNANSPLNNQAPSVVWMPSTTAPIARVEMYYEGCEIPVPDSVMVSNLACYGDADALVEVSISGNLGPYVMEWSTGDSNVTGIYDLEAGTYAVTITDSTGCRFDTSVVVDQPDSLYATASFEEPLCFGDANGSVFATGHGGVPPYAFVWNGGGMGNALMNVVAGAYVLTISDSNGCEALHNFELEQPDLLQVVLDSVVNNNCPGQEIGQIWTTITGGVGPYTSNWNDPNSTTSSVVFQLADGGYTFHVTDFNDCETSFTESISTLHQNPIVDLGPNVTMPATGPVTLYGPPNMASYQWSTGSNFDFTYVLTPGVYWLQVIDSNTCSDSDTVEVFPTPPLGMEFGESSALEVFPKLSKGRLTISTDHAPSDILVISALGQVVCRERIKSFPAMLDLQMLPAGKYWIRLNDQVVDFVIVP
jgi:hypothetical protein